MSEMLLNPFQIFHDWYDTVRREASLLHPGAMCLSTTGTDGSPDARFVDLKGVDRGFVFCTHLDSAKARSIARQDNVALTFWWDSIGRQVRVRGKAERLSDEEADEQFAARPREAQLTTWASRQSEKLTDSDDLASRIDGVRKRFANEDIQRPDHWGGYRIIPSSFEFLKFEMSRLHSRLVFERTPDGWSKYWLEP